MKKKVTIRDVAAKLGLSAMTVSLALRDHPRIPAETKGRIRAAMDKLGYRPNPVARALATGKSNLLGVIVPNSCDPYYAEVIRAVEDQASAANYHVLLANGSYDIERYTERVRDMIGLHVGGIIAAPPFTSDKPKLPPFWQSLLKHDLEFEVVLINRELRPPIFHQVAADYCAGVEMVADALAERGHSRVAYVSGRPAMLPIRQRLTAFKRCARQRGFDRDEALIEHCELTFAGGYEAGNKLWAANGKKPTAVVAFSDVVAVGLLRFFEESGVAVPHDVSVVSFDGTAVGEFTHISLSTVVTPMYEIGKRAYELLLGAMAGNFTAPQSLLLPVELKLRESIGKARRNS
ncbi:MAG TPA: LacI family DNA-binding transcriptional regulator [Blastocatellia bacterium]|nr:LacI family DNA-binding transcriptional regulator [Blastocatellia bacterium]HMV84150.1 LacI family DNA-binding transcriptional regulator [Blastocatellia bacterium]HMX25285.1 LacI family DNA-binding transcriptional regulator [Blastocatellia bacterium]HMY71313.1 LacI family DNA-binding transcriptional regulator [Blastocatellia bacterium]HMZ23073.1 LacI family DNA-binding transcriptional regulator [Blastocatellia bacterium]